MTDNNHEPISLGELRYRLHQRREAMIAKLEAQKNAAKAKTNKMKGCHDEHERNAGANS